MRNIKITHSKSRLSSIYNFQDYIFLNCQEMKLFISQVQEILNHALQMLPDTTELDSKIGINTDVMEAMDTTGSDQQGFDPCNLEDRIMCNVIDEMLLSNSSY